MIPERGIVWRLPCTGQPDSGQEEDDMKRYFFGAALAGTLAFVSAITAAQTPQTPPTTRPPTAQDPARPQQEAQTVTVEGCLMREEDVPGRRPNVAERAGISEDYILTMAKVVKGTAPGAAGKTPGRAGEQPTGTTGAAGTMYEVAGIDDEQLKPHIGHRVQIVGTFQNVDRATAPPEQRTPADDLVEIRATSIRPVKGNCPAKAKK
jgi:hypothetical protein